MEVEMTEQDHYIPGVPCWLDMTPPDPEAAAAFYGDLFGWEVEDVLPAGAPGRHLARRIRGRRGAGAARGRRAGRRGLRVGGGGGRARGGPGAVPGGPHRRPRRRGDRLAARG